MEAVLVPLITPSDSNATLGTVHGELKGNQAGKWGLPLAEAKGIRLASTSADLLPGCGRTRATAMPDSRANGPLTGGSRGGRLHGCGCRASRTARLREQYVSRHRARHAVVGRSGMSAALLGLVNVEQRLLTQGGGPFGSRANAS